MPWNMLHHIYSAFNTVPMLLLYLSYHVAYYQKYENYQTVCIVLCGTMCTPCCLLWCDLMCIYLFIDTIGEFKSIKSQMFHWILETESVEFVIIPKMSVVVFVESITRVIDDLITEVNDHWTTPLSYYTCNMLILLTY
jgi:hypothetical protein